MLFLGDLYLGIKIFMWLGNILPCPVYIVHASKILIEKHEILHKFYIYIHEYTQDNRKISNILVARVLLNSSLKQHGNKMFPVEVSKDFSIK